jgi:hypothetical protein
LAAEEAIGHEHREEKLLVRLRMQALVVEDKNGIRVKLGHKETRLYVDYYKSKLTEARRVYREKKKVYGMQNRSFTRQPNA